MPSYHADCLLQSLYEDNFIQHEIYYTTFNIYGHTLYGHETSCWHEFHVGYM